jgi:hypothetical protein
MYKLLSIYKIRILPTKYGAGIEQLVQRLATGWMTEGSEFESQYWQGFSFLHVVQTDSVAHPAYSYPGVKQPKREADYSPPTRAEVKNTWKYISTLSYAFRA